MKKRLLNLIIAVLAAIAILMGGITPQKAEASGLSAPPTFIWICNSADSVDQRLGAWNPEFTSIKWAERGRCIEIYNADGGARVIISFNDYKVKPAGGSYGPCHNPRSDSNPPNVTLVYYKLLASNYCETHGVMATGPSGSRWKADEKSISIGHGSRWIGGSEGVSGKIDAVAAKKMPADFTSKAKNVAGHWIKVRRYTDKKWITLYQMKAEQRYANYQRPAFQIDKIKVFTDDRCMRVRGRWGLSSGYYIVPGDSKFTVDRLGNEFYQFYPSFDDRCDGRPTWVI